ncbi:MAG: O-antigen ligase family protein [Lentisphaeria bacterium]|nr:O-antigen ligase family protein [Lentisphaeria bacterium]
MDEINVSTEKKSFSLIISCLFFLSALLFNPSIYFAPHRPWPMLFASCGALSFLAAGLIFLSPARVAELFSRMKKWVLAAFILFFLISFGQCFFIAGYSLECMGSNLIFLLVPLFICVYKKEAEKVFPYFLLVLWGWGLFLMVLARAIRSINYWRSGVSGNSNWSAAILAVATPFVVLLFYDYLRKKGISKRVTIFLCCIPALMGTGYFLYCRSAACLLAVLAASVFLFFCFLSAKWRKIFFLIGLICTIAGVLLFLRFGVDRLAGRMAYDERTVLWEGTINMIADHPLFGVGGQSFENAFVPYKPLDLFLKKHVAPRTGHPHNQILYMLASFGFAGWFCYLILHFYPLLFTAVRLWKKEEDLSILPYFFGAAVLTLHAQLDVVSVNWPTNIMELSLLGFLWHRTLFAESRGKSCIKQGKIFCKTSMVCGGILLLLACSMVCRSTYASCGVQALMTKKFTPQASRERVRNILKVYPEGYTQNYALLSFSRMILNDPLLTLEITDVMQKMHTPEYGNIHLFRGDAYSLLKKYDEAFSEYKKEARNWPLAVVPVCKMLVLAQMQKDSNAIFSLQQLLAKIMEAKNINKRMLEYILYKEPSLDLRPWLVPRKYGGQEGFGQPIQSE